MKFEAQAAAMTTKEIVELLAAHHSLKRSHSSAEEAHRTLEQSHHSLQQAHDELLQQVRWFRQQLFGRKSERRLTNISARQLALAEMPLPETEDSLGLAIPAHHRRRRKARPGGDEKLRFDPSVPVKEIVLYPEDWDPSKESDYWKISEKVTCRLAQHPGSFEVLRYVRPVYKKKADTTICCSAAPPAVLEKSFADVSFLAGMLIDKFAYYLPLYRQHQRLSAAGVHCARSTLTHLVHRTAELLAPIYRAQMRSVLESQVLAMDETPIKAGRKKRPPPGKMNTAYFWPIYGDRNEIVFPFATTRGAVVVQEALKQFEGVLLSDGYYAYEKYAKEINRIVHAQCWSHVRRKFVQAEAMEPEYSAEALAEIRLLYDKEADWREKELSGEKLLEVRAKESKPIVDRFFKQLKKARDSSILLPSNPFTKAAQYAQDRQKALRVFLEYPNVPLDTNHLEREIRPIALGRKNWMFCWTEVGAEYVGVVQSLLATCRLQGVDPYTYFVDVLQRIESHPAREIESLTPRLWKEKFAKDPMRSDIDRMGLKG